MIYVKEGVSFKESIGGAVILQALKTTSRMLNKDLTITSGCDGTHFDGSQEYRDKNEPNPSDPHYHGDAYDIRSHDMDNLTKQQFLANLNNLLSRDRFYYFLENPNTPAEHFHIQVKKGTTYKIQDFLAT
jgi:hypothetical protein